MSGNSKIDIFATRKCEKNEEEGLAAKILVAFGKSEQRQHRPFLQ